MTARPGIQGSGRPARPPISSARRRVLIADKAATAEGLRFFQWSFKNGDQIAASLDYVPFPEAVKQKIESSWSQVQGWTNR